MNLKAIDGYKTYIIAGLTAVVVFAKTMGWITEEQTTTIFGLLAALGLGTLRHGINKGTDK